MIKINLYTEKEKAEIWEKLAKEIHPYNLEDRTKEELISYIDKLEQTVYSQRARINYLETSCSYNNIKRYYTLCHKYKIELGRCVRKLTRLYKFLYKKNYNTYGIKFLAEAYIKELKNV